MRIQPEIDEPLCHSKIYVLFISFHRRNHLRDVIQACSLNRQMPRRVIHSKKESFFPLKQLNLVIYMLPLNHSNILMLLYYLAPLQNDSIVTSRYMQFTFGDKGELNKLHLSFLWGQNDLRFVCPYFVLGPTVVQNEKRFCNFNK